MNTAERAAYAYYFTALLPGAKMPQSKIISEYLGVHHCPCEASPWAAKVYHNKVMVYLGSKKTEKEAAKLVHKYGVKNNIDKFKVLGA